MDFPSVSSWDTPEWLDRFYDDNDVEESDDVPFPIYLIPTEGRNVIWVTTQKLLGTLSHGAASHACQLLERYLAAHLSSLTRLMSLGSAEWQTTKQQLKRKMLLIVTVCVQLVSKIHSANSRVNGLTIRRFLRRTHEEYTLQHINEVELHVYQTLGFRVPLWTNVDKAQMLAQEVGMPDSFMDCVGIIMDLTDYHRVVLQESVRGVAFETSSTNSSPSEPTLSPPATLRASIGLIEKVSQILGRIGCSWHFLGQGALYIDTVLDSPAAMGRICTSSVFDRSVSSPPSKRQPGANNIRNMHLVAGAVAAAFCFSPHTDLIADPIPHLAFLTRSPEPYIACIRNNIIDQVFKYTLVMKRPSEPHSPMGKSKRQRFD